MDTNDLRDRAVELGLSFKGSAKTLRERIDAEEARLRRSRKGNVIFARGNKAEVFATAARVAGYEVTVKKLRQGETIASASRGQSEITAAWSESGAWLPERTWSNRKRGSKIRNLAQAIAILAEAD